MIVLVTTGKIWIEEYWKTTIMNLRAPGILKTVLTKLEVMLTNVIILFFIMNCMNFWKTCITSRINISQRTKVWCYKITWVKDQFKVQKRPMDYVIK